jgi:hypothetical protein
MAQKGASLHPSFLQEEQALLMVGAVVLSVIYTRLLGVH